MFKINKFLFLTISLLLFNLSAADEWSLAEKVTNNAVAVADVSGQKILFSFNGLSENKTVNSIHAKAFSYNLETQISKQLANLPDNKPRLASIAVTVNNRIFVLGGYTVANDHTEVSTPEVYEYRPLENNYKLTTKIPVPVDDTVALVYLDRYIYLISGWHDDDNVNLVQVYDTTNNQWFNATPFPGAPVFGHAGGIVGNQFVIADGVKVIRVKDGKRQYGASNENWFATIDIDNPAKIVWNKIKKHPFKPLYRMGAVGLNKLKSIIFVGGSDNPYNYNGIGYNLQPSQPSPEIFSYDLNTKRWYVHQPMKQASMDHRGLLATKSKRGDYELYLMGGMAKNQVVLNKIQKIIIAQGIK